MEIKHCNKCGKDKPISEFGKNKSKKDGLQTMCKECVRAYGNWVSSLVRKYITPGYAE